MNSKPVMAFLREVFLYICCTLASPLWLMWRDDPVVKRVVRVQHVSEKHVCFKYSLLSHTKQALSQQLRDNNNNNIRIKKNHQVENRKQCDLRDITFCPKRLTDPSDFQPTELSASCTITSLLQPERVLLSGCLFNLTALNSETSV